MMKIGIVTFFKAVNYGAMLQAYALMKYLEKRGHEVRFIAHPRLMAKRIPLWRCFLHPERREIAKRLGRSFQYEITDFSRRFPMTREVKGWGSLVDVAKGFDAVVVGSDQMWNPAWCADKWLPLVMLDFVPKGVKRISYAVSFANDAWRDDQNKDLAARLMGKFDAISVREEYGVDLVRAISGRKDAKCLVDPTLLVDFSFYDSVISENAQASKMHSREYLFKYILEEWEENHQENRVEERVKSFFNVSLVVSDRKPPPVLFGQQMWRYGISSRISVPEWLYALARAKVVLTNSFHGTVFAIMFHRPFISVLLTGRMSMMNVRITSLLKSLGLERCAICGWDESKVVEALSFQPDWDDVDRRLCRCRGDTSGFFSEIGL